MQGEKNLVLHRSRWCIKSVHHRGPCCTLPAQITALTDLCIGLSGLLITLKPSNLIRGRFLSNTCYLCCLLTFCIRIQTHTSAKLEQINGRLSCVYTVNPDCALCCFSVLCRSAGLSNAAWYRSNTRAELQLSVTFLLSGKNHKYAVFDVFTARSAESGQVQVSLGSWMRVFFSGFSETGKTTCFLTLGCECTAESWQWALLRRLKLLSQLYSVHLNIVAEFSSLA